MTQPTARVEGSTLVRVAVVFDVVWEKLPPNVTVMSKSPVSPLASSVSCTVNVIGQFRVSGVPEDAVLERVIGLARTISEPVPAHVNWAVPAGVNVSDPPPLPVQVVEETAVIAFWESWACVLPAMRAVSPSTQA